MSTRLGVKIDQVAALRQARKDSHPDPVAAAMLAEIAGARSITLHLRQDRRHVQDRDLRVLRDTVKTVLNLEMAATTEMVKTAFNTRPERATLVPERIEELTTEGGLDILSQKDALRSVIRTLRDAQIQTCIFIDPDLDQVKAAHRVDAQVVELHAGRYTSLPNGDEQSQEIARLIDCAKAANKLGMKVAVGHGLNYENVIPLASVTEISELIIGHAIISRAVLVGIESAVHHMVDIIRAAKN